MIETAGADEFFVDLTERIVRLDQRTLRQRRPVALRTQRLAPERTTPQGWVVLPLLQLRAAAAVALPSIEELGLIWPQQRDNLVAALGRADITSRLHLLSSNTPASALSPDSEADREGLGVWKLTPDAHQSGEAASYRLGGNAAAGLSALVTIRLPMVGANTGSIVIALDIALSLMKQVRLAEVARLLRDGLILTSATLPATLEDVLPAEAEVTLAELHIAAPTTMGDITARDNDLHQRIDLSPLGKPSRPVGPTMGFAARLAGPLTEDEATVFVADAVEYMALAAGYTDPRIGIRGLRHELGIAPHAPQ